MNEYLTVKEFAAAAGVSQQYIYKILNTILKPYTKTINKRKMIDKEGLKVIVKENSTDDTTNSTVDCKPDTTAEKQEIQPEIQPELQTKSTGNSTNNSTADEAVNRLISLLEKQLEEAGAERRSKIGTGDRAEKIRTYNYPQNRVTDHRIGFTTKNLDRVMDGDLSDVINALVQEDQKRKLKGEEE